MATETAATRPPIAEAYASFLGRYPEYAETEAIDRLRATEYRRLDEQHQVYLDYTGGSLYCDSQVEQHIDLLRNSVLGNPHSHNPTSSAMTEHVERTRRAVLDYFGGTSDYILVFTQNASGALKLIGESFPFTPAGRLLLTFDNHNSVNGIREFARAKGAQFSYAPLVAPDLRLDRKLLERSSTRPIPLSDNLFAFPAQSNFSGVKHPLDLVSGPRTRDGACCSTRRPLFLPILWTCGRCSRTL